jgi:ATP-dependent Clp protease ATP-binding subunit ClpA
MFERFSGQARHVVVSAQEEARELDHNYIGTEHLLLGLLTSDSLASASLNALGYTRDDVQAKVLATVGRGKASPGGHIPFTPRAKKVLELSLREALQLKHNYIGTEHILLGLLREGEGMAAQILADKHPLDRIRGEVLTRIESPAPREVHGAGRTPAAHDVLALAAELAGEGPVGSQHILEAMLQ